MSNWSELNHDILALIAKRVKVIEDFLAFGAVCTSWRIVAIKDNFDCISPQVPLLMLAEKDDDLPREFYSLSKQKIARRLSLPETRQRRCFSSHGWLCIPDPKNSGEVYLLHPFSRTKIQPPYLREDFHDVHVPLDKGFYVIHRAALSASPSLTSDYVVMLSYYENNDNLAFWRPGDMSWTIINLEKMGFDKWGGFIDVHYFNGQFYSVTVEAQVWAFDIPTRSSSPQPTVHPRLVARLEYDDFGMYDTLVYLVQSSGALLLIKRSSKFVDHPTGGNVTTGFKILELDVVTGKEKEIKTLGDNAIFLGFNTGIYVEISKSSGIKSNCIYFTDDWVEEFSTLEGGGGRDMGAYNLEDGKIQSFYLGESLSPICPPIWVTPSF